MIAAGLWKTRGNMSFYGPDLAFAHDAGFGFWARGAMPGLLRMLGHAGIESGTVVELGCGSGIAAAMFVDAGYDYFGVDLSAPLVQIARARVPGATFVHGSLHDVQIPRCRAVVAMGEILSYAQVTDELLAHVREALEPAGLFVFDVATPDRGTSRSWHQGDGWLVCADAVERDGRLTRSIATFRAVDDCWRRSDEVHELALYEPAGLVARLGDAGFADPQALGGGYGPELELPEGIAVLSARTP